MKASMDEENLKEKISEDEKRTISSKCDEALKWLDGNQLAEVEEFQDKQKEGESVCNPIISKLYQQGGAPGGGMHNGMPSGMPSGMHNGMPNGMHNGMHTGMHNGMSNGTPNGMPKGTSNSGPTIEEVD